MYVVICIGCLECSIPSELVGTFTTEAEADGIVEKLEAANTSSQVAFQSFKVGKLGEINKDYKELALDKTNA